MRKNVYFHYALLLLVIIVSCSHLTVVIHYVNIVLQFLHCLLRILTTVT